MVEVMPAGLSMTSQPSMRAPLRLRATAVLLVALAIRRRGPEVADHARVQEETVELGCASEGGVGLELELGRMAQPDRLGELSAQVGGSARERFHEGGTVPTTEAQDPHARMAEVGAHAHAGHGDGHAREIGVAEMAALDDMGEGVTNRLADALLALALRLEILSRHAGLTGCSTLLEDPLRPPSLPA